MKLKRRRRVQRQKVADNHETLSHVLCHSLLFIGVRWYLFEKIWGWGMWRVVAYGTGTSPTSGTWEISYSYNSIDSCL